MYINLNGIPTRVWEEATLVATFTDGEVIRYPRVQYLAVAESVANAHGFHDPIKVNGTTLKFEDNEIPYTALGVRSFFLDWD